MIFKEKIIINDFNKEKITINDFKEKITIMILKKRLQ